MIRYIFATFLAVAALSTTPAHAQVTYITGNELHRDCSADGEGILGFQSRALCMGYIAGVVDAFTTSAMVAGVVRGEDTEVNLLCIPEGVEMGQLIDLTKDYLKNNPGDRHFTASFLVYMALSKQFPCS